MKQLARTILFTVLPVMALPAPSTAAPTAGQQQELSAITHSAERGNQGAQLLLGLTYLEGRDGVAPDLKKAFEWLERAAQEGQPYAQYRLGQLYANGQGVAADPQRAAEWWRRASEQGVEAAQLALGEAYLWGRGVPKSAPEAERWLARAADQGNAQAQYRLGRMYYQGQGVPQDLVRGREWLSRAAARGHSAAIKLLHFLVDVGEDTSLVHEQSGEELRQRAEADDLEAQYQLAMRYESGAWGVERDEAKALYWFRRSADQAYAPSLRTLSEAYSKGLLGLEPDSRRAASLRAQADALQSGK